MAPKIGNKHSSLTQQKSGNGEKQNLVGFASGVNAKKI